MIDCTSYDDAACTTQFAYAIGGRELDFTQPVSISAPTKIQCVTKKTDAFFSFIIFKSTVFVNVSSV